MQAERKTKNINIRKQVTIRKSAWMEQCTRQRNMSEKFAGIVKN